MSQLNCSPSPPFVSSSSSSSSPLHRPSNVSYPLPQGLQTTGHTAHEQNGPPEVAEKSAIATSGNLLAVVSEASNERASSISGPGEGGWTVTPGPAVAVTGGGGHLFLLFLFRSQVPVRITWTSIQTIILPTLSRSCPELFHPSALGRSSVRDKGARHSSSSSSSSL